MKTILLIMIASLIAGASYAQSNTTTKKATAAAGENEKADTNADAPTKDQVNTAATQTKETTEISDSASKYRCEHAGMLRRIEIVTSNPETDPEGNACKVEYTKETEKPGEVQTLWTAQNGTEYCKEKAADLANKHEGWGWSCTSEQ